MEKLIQTQGAEKINILYTGYFVKDIPALTSQFIPKHEKVLGHHSTIAFKPGTLDGTEVGTDVALKVIGRVSDEKGDALLVESPKSNNKHPHITLSVAKGVSPVYSNEMIENAFTNGTVELFPEPIIIDTTEGYFDGKQDILTC